MLSINGKSLKRLEDLKQATIIKDFSDIDYNDPKSLYTKLLNNVFYGDFSSLACDYLEDLDEESKQKLIGLVKKYVSILFFAGQFDLWSDSLDGVYRNDYELNCMILLANYDFLVSLADEGGEDVLKFLTKFQEKISDNSVIEYLRNRFNDDELLKKLLLNIGDSYKNFTDEEKVIMFIYPNNVLFKDNNGVNELIPITELESIKKKSNSIEEFENSIKRVFYQIS